MNIFFDTMSHANSIQNAINPINNSNPNFRHSQIINSQLITQKHVPRHHQDILSIDQSSSLLPVTRHPPLSPQSLPNTHPTNPFAVIQTVYLVNEISKIVPLQIPVQTLMLMLLEHSIFRIMLRRLKVELFVKRLVLPRWLQVMIFAKR